MAYCDYYKDKKILDITLKYAEENNLQIYGSYGIRDDFSTELDMIIPPPSEQEQNTIDMGNLAIKLNAYLNDENDIINVIASSCIRTRFSSC